MKSRIYILITVFVFQFFFSSNLTSQISLEWSKFFYNNNNFARSLCLDDTLNVYIAGGNKILKYNPSGNLQYHLNYYLNGSAYKVIYSDGYIFAGGGTGLVKYSIPGTYNLLRGGDITDILKDNNGYIYSVADNLGDMTIDKYNSAGTIAWSNQILRNTANSYYSNNVFVGVNNSINIFGTRISYYLYYSYTPILLSYDTYGNLITGPGTFNTYYTGVRNDYSNTNVIAGVNNYSVYQSDISISNINNLVNPVTYNGIGNGKDEVNEIASDNFGNVYLACKSWGVGVDYDFVILKYNSDLELIWEYRYNGSQNAFDEAKKVVVGNSGNIYATGNINMNNHGKQIYTVKLSQSGQLLWSDKFSRYDRAVDTNDVMDLQLDRYENIYLCGNSRDSVNNRYDFLTVKYSDPTSINTNEINIVNDFELLQNYPNPFNPVTNIGFKLPKNSNVKIDVFNSSGKIIDHLTDKTYPQGEHNVTWNAESFPSGVYFIRFSTGTFLDIKKAVLIK
ncbi:MAG: T9SS type A sorting domain-containing protein [Ignavibacteria bacterium]